MQTNDGPRQAMTYVMTTGSYLGLPSPWYLGRIEQGFTDWGLPLHELKRALAETEAGLAALGVEDYRPDGRKRMRALLGDDELSGATQQMAIRQPQGQRNL